MMYINTQSAAQNLSQSCHKFAQSNPVVGVYNISNYNSTTTTDP